MTNNGNNNDKVCGENRNSRSRTDNMFDRFNESKNKGMIKEPKLPHRLKWGDRTAARVDEVDYLIDIRVVGYTSIKGLIIVEVHESVADEVGAWSIPEDSKYRGLGGGDVFMKKPRAGAYYKYINLKNIVHEES